MKRVAITGSLVAAALTTAFVLSTPRTARAQDAAQVKKGEEVYAAQKCQMCHAIAGKGNKQNPLDGIGAKLSADDIKKWIIDPGRDDEAGEVDQETAHAEEVGEPSGRRPRRARRLHAEPEVGPSACQAAAPSLVIRSRWRASC